MLVIKQLSPESSYLLTFLPKPTRWDISKRSVKQNVWKPIIKSKSPNTADSGKSYNLNELFMYWRTSKQTGYRPIAIKAKDIIEPRL